MTTVNHKRAKLLTALGLRRRFEDANIFFVVTTGRSGSQTIAHTLSQHPRIECEHEPHPELIRLSAELAHGEKSTDAVREELREIYSRRVYPRNKWVGESDQKYWNLIPLLAELMPLSKFIWLIRDGRDAVASMCAWGWYPSGPAQQGAAPTDVSGMWLYYRENGWRCGSVSQEKWNQMSALDKSCWYWNHVNSAIEKQLALLSRDRWIFVKLERLEHEVPRLFDHLCVKQAEFNVLIYNKALHPVSKWETWEMADKKAFDRWCGPSMDRWYPDWTDRK